MDNQQLKNDEIQALSAIYAEDWNVEDTQSNSFSITLHSDNDTNKNKQLKLVFKLPEKYPLEEKAIYLITAPWMSRDDKVQLATNLDLICDKYKGESVLYILVEKAKEILNEIFNNDTYKQDEDISHLIVDDSIKEDKVECQISIQHGEPFVDRRSTFQAHLAPVHSTDDVHCILDKLKENKKIASATHNIWSYRIVNDSGIVNQDCDDDGETHAGSRLLHLLQIVGAKNVLVVVSRWYGGIQLGPDRFKHINNVAREILVKYNYIN